MTKISSSCLEIKATLFKTARTAVQVMAFVAKVSVSVNHTSMERLAK